jgi:hypothetical protein
MGDHDSFRLMIFIGKPQRVSQTRLASADLGGTDYQKAVEVEQ